MSKWVIDKQFSFCYGHRVWTQKLLADYCESGDSSCKCRHLHGHEGLVHVFLEGESLERGMVTDFKHLGWLKNFLDKYVDHRFLIHREDPMFRLMVNKVHEDLSGTMNLKLIPVLVPGTTHEAGYSLDLTGLPADTADYEVLEGYFVVDFVPTSENLSQWLFNCVKAKMDLINVKVSQIDWYETPKSRSSYRG